jgi:hypothetical protein
LVLEANRRIQAIYGTCRLGMERIRTYELERDAVDNLWQRTLLHIPSSYGRLVYLASLRNPDTGRYEHYGLSLNPNNADANRAVRQSHEAIFQEWVGYSLEHKKADLDLYITTIEEVDKTQLIDAWLRLTPYKNLVPASIQGPERQRHISDFEALLGLLKNVYGVPCPYLDA